LIAAEVDPGVRVEEVHSLDEWVRREDLPAIVASGAIVGIVSLGLFLSAAGIFSLMSVSVARRTREIGLRAALGAGSRRLLASVLSHALVLIGSGILVGNLVLLVLVFLAEASVWDVAPALMLTSAIMLTVGLLACLQPAMRALRIAPTDALKEA
jgi:ABC-type antimicrobial peptide transport system permease subunit